MELGKNYCYGIGKNSNDIFVWPLLFTTGDSYYRIPVDKSKPWNHKRKHSKYYSDSVIRKLILKNLNVQICPAISTVSVTQKDLVESCKTGTVNLMYIGKDGWDR